MKKIIIIKILSLVLILLSGAFMLSACGGVEFNINFIVDGEIYATVSTGGAETIKMPDNPIKDDYTFDGWFWDKDTWKKPFTANSLLDAPLSSDMNVYAKFTLIHNHNYTETVIAPTCTEQGYTIYTCECGESYKDNYVNELGHEFTDYVSDNNATYDSDGTKTARCNHGCGAKDTIIDVGTKLKSEITFKTLSVDSENNVFGKVANTQETFSFVNEINVIGNAEFYVSTDIYGINQIPTKTVPLSIGNNTFYVTETVDSDIKLFIVSIRRKPIYDVSFITECEIEIATLSVEEDDYATEPTETLVKAGYAFTGWSYDFNTPIIEDTVISANWTANENTKYNVRYLLQNLEDNDYTPELIEELTGKTDTQANAEIKTFEHFTYNASESVISGNINGDETTVLSVYYTRDVYDFTVNNGNAKGGMIDCTPNGNYKFGKQISLSVEVNDGYDFIGWYNGDNQVSNELEYSFTLTEKTDITAKFTAHKNTKYTVETYLENLDGTYIKQNTAEKFGETDTTATIQPTAPEHYNYNESQSVISGNINGDGSLLLKEYYTREVYTVTFDLDGGTRTGGGSLTQSIKYQGSATAPIFTKSGYTFIEFDKDFSSIESDVTVLIKWCKVTLAVNDSNAGSVSALSETYNVGDTVTVTATTNTGYTFVGWFNGEEELTKELIYTFDMPSVDITYTATWTFYTFATVNENTTMGSISDYNETKISVGDNVTLTANPKTGYTFFGWYNGDTFVSGSLIYSFDMPNENLVYTAKWTYYTLTVINEKTTAGTVSNYNNTKITVGQNIQLTATAKSGFTFKGWYINEELITDALTYSFDMPNENVTYTAKWTFYTLTTINEDTTAGSIPNCTNQKITAGGIKTITATPNSGYTFAGWYDGETELTTNLSYTFNMPKSNLTYTAKWCKVTIEKSISSAGTVTSLTGKYKVGDIVTVTATTKQGYAWLGWYNGETEVTKDLTFSFCMTKENVTYTATWVKVTIGKNLSYAGNTTSLSGKYVVGDTVTITATVNLGYTWLGWYNGETELTKNLTYTFNIPDKSVTYTAKWQYNDGMENFEFYSSSSTLTITGIKDKTIKEIVVPYYVTSINEGAFAGCSQIESITLPFVGDRIKTKDDTYQYPFGYIFGTSEFTDSIETTQYYFGSSTESNLDTGIYYIPSSLKTVTITGGNILYNAFASCIGLENIIIENGITTIERGAFSGCSRLKNIYLSSNITILPDYAFSGCSSLTDFVVPDNTTSIGSKAFSGCYGLKNITIGCGVINIGELAFEYCSGLETITVKNENAKYYSENNCLIEKTSDNFYVLGGGSSTTINNCIVLGCKNSIIPTDSNVKTIGKYAFYGCSDLTSITIPDNILFIGEYAFSGCYNLVEVIDNSRYVTITKGGYDNGYIGYYALVVKTNGESDIINKNGYLFYTYDGVNYLLGYNGNETDLILPNDYNGENYEIYKYAFYNNIYLTSIIIPDSVTNIGTQSFRGCNNLTSIIIPDSVTNIGTQSFWGCNNLTKIELGKNLKTIGESAFYNCENISEVYFNGTEGIWAKITIGRYNTLLTSAPRYYYSENYPENFAENTYWHYVDGNPVVWTKEN